MNHYECVQKLNTYLVNSVEYLKKEAKENLSFCLALINILILMRCLRARTMFLNESRLFISVQQARRKARKSVCVGGHVVRGGHNLPRLVEIGLTDLPKYGRGRPRPPWPPGSDSLAPLRFSSSSFHYDLGLRGEGNNIRSSAGSAYVTVLESKGLLPIDFMNKIVNSLPGNSLFSSWCIKGILILISKCSPISPHYEVAVCPILVNFSV